MKTRTFELITAAAVLAALQAAARAENMVAIEAYAGERPNDADALLAPVLGEMQSRGFVTGAPLAERVASHISMDARVLGDAKVTEAKRAIETGVKQYREGKYEAAVKAIEHGKSLLDSAPATMAKQQQTRDLMLEALIYLAQANNRRGRAVEATRAMAELIRSFPDKEISHARHGPEPRKLFRKVKSDLKGQGVGSLEIVIDDPKTVVFVNERYVGGGDTVVKNLFPGRYRVFVQQGEKAGRVHEVDVDAGRKATLSLSWGIDSSLRTGDEHVALVYESEGARTKLEPEHAIRVARALNASGVAVIGVRDYKGRRSVIGTLLSPDSTKPIRTAVLAVEPVAPSEKKLRALGRFLAGDEAAAKLFANLATAGGNASGEGGPSDRKVRRPYRTWKWVGLLGGLATVGTGVTLIAIHQPETSGGVRQEDARNSRTAGIITTAVGGVLVGAGIYFWVRDRKDARKSRMAVVPTKGGAAFVLSGSF